MELNTTQIIVAALMGFFAILTVSALLKHYIFDPKKVKEAYDRLTTRGGYQNVPQNDPDRGLLRDALQTTFPEENSLEVKIHQAVKKESEGRRFFLTDVTVTRSRHSSSSYNFFTVMFVPMDTGVSYPIGIRTKLHEIFENMITELVGFPNEMYNSIPEFKSKFAVHSPNDWDLQILTKELQSQIVSQQGTYPFSEGGSGASTVGLGKSLTIFPQGLVIVGQRTWDEDKFNKMSDFAKQLVYDLINASGELKSQKPPPQEDDVYKVEL